MRAARLALAALCLAAAPSVAAAADGAPAPAPALATPGAGWTAPGQPDPVATALRLKAVRSERLLTRRCGGNANCLDGLATGLRRARVECAPASGWTRAPAPLPAALACMDRLIAEEMAKAERLPPR